MLYFRKNISIFFCFLVIFGCTSQPVQEQIPPQAQEMAPAEEEPHSSGENNDTENNNFVEMRPPVLDRDELTVAFSKGHVELDFRMSYLASEAQIFTAIYEGLFSYNPVSLEPVLAAAEKWELSEDKKQWTFTIRQRARFDNGDPLRAEDFRAAWLSLLEPERESPYSSLFDIIEGARDFRSGTEKDPEKVGIFAPEEKILIVKLNSPASFFPAMLCHHSFSPIHPSMLKKKSWNPDKGDKNWTPPVSNGPFRIDTMAEDSIIFFKNNLYWDRRNVSFNKLTIKFTETAQDASELWNSGEARWISGDVNLETLTDRSGIQVNIMFATHYYFIRCNAKPWNDFRVRRAMSLVLPWEEIRRGYTLPAETLIFPIAGYPKVDGLTETNYEEAQRLMKEAGLTDRDKMPELVIRLTPSRDAARIGGIMASAWKENLMLNVRVEVIPFERYFQSMKESNYHIGSSTWIGDFADPYTFLQIWRRDSNLNDAQFDDADYEALIEKSMMEEGNVRLATLANAEKLLLDRGAVLPISYSPALNIIDTGEMSGWYPNALDIHPFKYLSFKDFRPLPGVAMIN
ncbi:MAG: peptide ABC transporter substrate-binding protein [Treponema sp.]|jgi:peptide/nickel transport system substrate-binding protein/oligopeptide transport system substrate-binding protein|nr:peptide ABC transporter substrate-binding protein [Treponema sp.]